MLRQLSSPAPLPLHLHPLNQLLWQQIQGKNIFMKFPADTELRGQPTVVREQEQKGDWSTLGSGEWQGGGGRGQEQAPRGVEVTPILQVNEDLLCAKSLPGNSYETLNQCS